MDTRERVLLNAARFAVVELHTKGADGVERKRQVVRHPGAVCVVPETSDGGICLIRNRRAAVDATLIELPAGTLETGESPHETAHRELVEETGYQAGSLTKLTEFYLSPGILDERMHLYLARELTAVGANREAGEEIENLEVDWATAMRLLGEGQIEDAKTIVGLLYYGRFNHR